MGWKDEQIAKVKAVMSNAQMYKQTGNGIVVAVINEDSAVEDGHRY